MLTVCTTVKPRPLSFVFVATFGRNVRWMRRRPTARILSGVAAASLGLLAGVLEQFDDTELVDVVTFILACIALAMLMSTRINPAWLIAAGVVMGVVHALIT